MKTEFEQGVEAERERIVLLCRKRAEAWLDKAKSAKTEPERKLFRARYFEAGVIGLITDRPLPVREVT